MSVFGDFMASNAAKQDDEITRLRAELAKVKQELDNEYERVLRRMYSLARAETAKEVIEAAAAMCRIVASDCETGRYYERHYEVSAAQMCEKAVRALASRYAETPGTGKEK